MRLKEKRRKRDIIKAVVVVIGFSVFIYGSVLRRCVCGVNYREGDYDRI